MLRTARFGAWQDSVPGDSAPVPDSPLRCMAKGVPGPSSGYQVLKITTSTVHKYVDTLHRHFGVSTNGELMAMLLAGPAQSEARA